MSDPQPTHEARRLDSNELHEMREDIESVYREYRDNEPHDDESFARLFRVTEDLAPALLDSLLLERARCAALEEALGSDKRHLLQRIWDTEAQSTQTERILRGRVAALEAEREQLRSDLQTVAEGLENIRSINRRRPGDAILRMDDEARTALAFIDTALATSPPADGAARAREEMLRRLEWSSQGFDTAAMEPVDVCPICGGWQENGHAAGCALAALLNTTVAADGAAREANPYRDAAVLLANLTDWVEGENLDANAWYREFIHAISLAHEQVSAVEPDYSNAAFTLNDRANADIRALTTPQATIAPAPQGEGK